MTKPLTDQAYWNNNFGAIDFFRFSDAIPEDPYISRYLLPDQNKTCIEIGAYPGGNLGYFVKKFGFQPTALDFLDNARFIVENMRHNGIENCQLINQDFLAWQPDRQYDVVASFGFVEHFIEYDIVIQKHIDILKPGGYLILSVPYLEYYQLWVRKWFYLDAHMSKILKSHNRKIMNLGELKRQVTRQNNLQVLFAGHIREMTTWFPKSPAILKPNMLKYYDGMKMLEKIFAWLGWSSRFFSPAILLIAQKHSSH